MGRTNASPDSLRDDILAGRADLARLQFRSAVMPIVLTIWFRRRVACACAHRLLPARIDLPAWLFTILRNLFRSDYRKRRREVEDADGSYAKTLKSQPAQSSHLEFEEFRSARQAAAGSARSAYPRRRFRLLL
jgi:RNA polymerase sigma-70 factor (ECF subfamily)